LDHPPQPSAPWVSRTFGNDVVLIEKYVTQPRHIEVQVFGDGTDAVHLFERDCSLQRRHQKVIEEAPAPGMTPQMRSAMGQAAVRAAKAVGYSGAGTVEFIVDGSNGLDPDAFWFMEMNTRLQVEHPVTEAITGVDLVDWQLRVAAGEGLPMRQEELFINGHSFEARIYAEDVPAGFLPATGRLDHLEFAQGARIDTGVRQGDEITPFYDPMIAKLTVHAQSREAALRQLDRALAGTQIAGTVTNIAFLRALARHEDFATGDVDTGLIERGLDALAHVAVPCSKSRALAAVSALGAADNPLAGFTLWEALPQEVVLIWDEEAVAARVTTLSEGAYRVAVGDSVHSVTRHGVHWAVDGQKSSAKVVRHGAGITVFWGNTYTFQTVDPLERAAGAMLGGDVTLAPMPGLVKAVFVVSGEAVAEGDNLAVLEAMKMEHVLRASRSGVVAEVYVTQDAQIAAGAPMIALEPEE